MRFVFALVAVAILGLSGCKRDNLAVARVLQYEVSSDEYAVVVIQQEGMTHEQARQQALQQAAQLTQDKGVRYFAIEREDQVQAVLAQKPDGISPPSSNLYYNEIQRKDFSREEELETPSNVEQSPGYRITFKIYQDNPPQNAIDSCTLVPCH